MVKKFFDVILGRSRPIKPKMENVFAMSTAYVTLTAELNLSPTDRAGICLRPPQSAAFEQMGVDLDRLLEISSLETGAKVEKQTDSYGFQWIIINDPNIEGQVATVHVFSQTVHENGFGEQLLAAVFKFLDGERPVYFIYNYKRGKYYPFVPVRDSDHRRDNAYELRLRATVQRELPLEDQVERWYALWGVPV
jgi:hypothetical protein